MRRRGAPKAPSRRRFRVVSKTSEIRRATSRAAPPSMTLVGWEVPALHTPGMSGPPTMPLPSGPGQRGCAAGAVAEAGRATARC